MLILAADFRIGRVLRSEGLLANPWALVAEAEDVGRAGLLSGGRRGLELGVLDRGFRPLGVVMLGEYVVCEGKTVEEQSRDRSKDAWESETGDAGSESKRITECARMPGRARVGYCAAAEPRADQLVMTCRYQRSHRCSLDST